MGYMALQVEHYCNDVGLFLALPSLGSVTLRRNLEVLVTSRSVSGLWGFGFTPTPSPVGYQNPRTLEPLCHTP